MVSSKLGGILLTKEKGTDLFIELLETFIEGDRDEDIELDFLDAIVVGPEFIQGFIDSARDSQQFPIYSIQHQVIWSGLCLTDIETIGRFMTESKSEKSKNANQDMQKQLEKQLEEILLVARSEGSANPSQSHNSKKPVFDISNFTNPKKIADLTRSLETMMSRLSPIMKEIK